MQMEKKGRSRTTDYYLSDDVLMDVLSRVPARSLLRFKSISKHWSSLILNPDFISLHHSRAKPCCGVFLVRDRKRSTCFLPDQTSSPSPTPAPNPTAASSSYEIESGPRVYSPCLLPDQTSIDDLDLSFDGLHTMRGMGFAYNGSCNGLMCFSRISNVEMNIVIFNPATKEYRLLPQPPFHTRQWRTYCLAFGFDSRTNDYIVARVAVLRQNTYAYDVVHQIHVYGMGADSWEEIAATVPNHRFFFDYFQRYISLDGVFYWLNYNYTTRVRVIHAMNTVERLFEQISLPAGLSSIHQQLHLCPLDDSPALLQQDGKRGDLWFDVWLMDKYGVEEFWTKKYTIGPFLGNGHSFGIQVDSEVLLIRRHNKQIFLYDHRTKDIKEYNQLRNVPAGSILFIIDVFPYVESLVPVKRRVATSANS